MDENKEDQSVLDKLRSLPRSLPDKKRYAELITAFLSIPVLLTIIISNINNLRSNNNQENISPTPIVTFVPVVTEKEEAASNSNDTLPSVLPSATASISMTPLVCKKEVGPVTISYPKEGDTLIENPVTVVVNYEIGEYCGAVWSYRINGGNWSPFDDKSFALYNMPSGEVRLDLRVKSIASSQEVYVTRKFIYSPPVTPSVTPTITPTPSLQ